MKVFIEPIWSNDNLHPSCAGVQGFYIREINYRKGFIVGEVTPAVTAWDPLYDGMIPNGLIFNLTICNVIGSTTDGNNVTTGSRSGPDGDWATIYVTSLAGDDPVYGIRKLHEGMALRRFKRTSDDTWIKIKDISG